jgi:hypothetical protein
VPRSFWGNRKSNIIHDQVYRIWGPCTSGFCPTEEIFPRKSSASNAGCSVLLIIFDAVACTRIYGRWKKFFDYGPVCMNFSRCIAQSAFNQFPTKAKCNFTIQINILMGACKISLSKRRIFCETSNNQSFPLIVFPKLLVRTRHCTGHLIDLSSKISNEKHFRICRYLSISASHDTRA